MIRLLITDDSSFMRMRLRTMVEEDNNIKVIGIARNGADAVEKAITLKPDVITMDVTMPDMNGLEAVAAIMDKYPTPIIMVSALTSKGADITIKALELGAVDYIPKDNLNAKMLIEKIYEAVNAFKSHVPSSAPTQKLHEGITKADNAFSLIAIGISTGGPKALADVIPFLSPSLPVPIVIVQHMPPVFTESLAKRLDSLSKIHVKEAVNNEKLKPGTAYICPGGMNATFEKRDIITLYPKEQFNYLYIPSADLLMSSAGEIYGEEALLIIMTGMGADGLRGISKAKQRGSFVMAQSELSSTIYGMPKAIIDNNLQDEIFDLKNLSHRINSLCK